MQVETNFRSYGGKELFSLELKKRDWLVENIIRERQSVVFVGQEKSGKSVFIKQLICSLTSQHPFLDRMKVLKPCRVSYVQLEGELEDTQDRFNRMVMALDINPDLFKLHYYQPLNLQDTAHALKFCNEIIDQWQGQQLDVLILDPIYFAFNGSLSDDAIVRQFIGNMRLIKDKLQCALILVHHTHKTRFDVRGRQVDEKDEAIFGSKFLKAFPDHILMFTYDKRDGTRILSCETQRGGDILKEARLKLIEPIPLYFQEINLNPTKEATVLNLLSNSEHYEHGLSAKEVSTIAQMSESAFYNSVKRLLGEQIVEKVTEHRPIKYRLRRKEGSIVQIRQDN